MSNAIHLLYRSRQMDAFKSKLIALLSKFLHSQIQAIHYDVLRPSRPSDCFREIIQRPYLVQSSQKSVLRSMAIDICQTSISLDQSVRTLFSKEILIDYY